MTIIREIQESDAENFLALCNQLEEENRFMMLEPGERKTWVEEQAQRILERATGRGLGTRLFETLENWAKEHKLHRLELTVMVHNQRGVGLYQKMGFEVEGTKRDSLLVDGLYVDEYYMSKLI